MIMMVLTAIESSLILSMKSRLLLMMTQMIAESMMVVR